MAEMTAELGRRRRIAAIMGVGGRRALVIALDHGMFMGPISGARVLRPVLKSVLDCKPHAIQLAPGAVTGCASLIEQTESALVYRLDTTNVWRPKPMSPRPGYWAPISSPLEALRAGASAAVAFLLGGWEHDEMEQKNLSQVAVWSRECRDLGLPFILEPLPLSGKVDSSQDGEMVRILARVATEIGCDILKLDFSGDVDSFTELVADAGVPILVRGGPTAPNREAYLAHLQTALRAGAKGLVVGRNAFAGGDVAKSMADLFALLNDHAVELSNV